MRFAFGISALFLILYSVNLILLLSLNRIWWRRASVRRAFKWLPLAVLACGLVWALGLRLDATWLSRLGAGSLSAVFVYLLSLLIALLVTSPVNAVVGLFDLTRHRILPRVLRRSSTATPVELEPIGGEQLTSPDRRRFLRTALAAVPALSGLGATSGLISASSPARIPRIPLRYEGLPESLVGLKIFHISDIHIGPYVDLGDLEDLAERGSRLRPDLVLVTGDICDHLPSYLNALKIIEAIAAPSGIFACLGNHEYFRGIEAVRANFERSSIPLLVDEGTTVPIGNVSVHIGGADDPRWMRGPESYRKLRRSVEDSQRDAGVSAGFRILMSHRSLALDYAAPLGVDLTLAGHTHGAQMGLGGRSLFEPWYPDRYLWGHYQKGRSQLYTSAGVGHWFPFRLGCPPEAPLFVLETA